MGCTVVLVPESCSNIWNTSKCPFTSFYCEVCRISSLGDCWFLALGQLKVCWHRWRPFRPSVLMSLLPRMVRRFSDHGRPPLVSYGQISSPPDGFTLHMHRGSKSFTSCTMLHSDLVRVGSVWTRGTTLRRLFGSWHKTSFISHHSHISCDLHGLNPFTLDSWTACDQAVMDHPEMQELVQTDQPSAVIMGSALGRVAWILEAV